MSNNNENKHKLNRGFMNLDVGSFVKFEGDVYKISLQLEKDKVVLINIKDGTTKSCTISELSPLDESIYSFNMHRNLQDFSDKEWKVLARRLKAIKPLIDKKTTNKDIDKQAKEFKVSRKTIYRWRQQYERTNSVIGMLPDKTGYAKGTKLLDDEVENIISQYIDSHYLKSQRRSAAKVIKYIRKECDKQGINPPGDNTVRRRISDIHPKTALKHRGFLSLAKTYDPKTGKYPETSYPLEVVQIDHTPTDILIVDDYNRLEIGRAWLTLAIDIHTRMVVGFNLTLDAPSITSVALCMANAINPKEKWLKDRGIDAIWPVWGRMNRIATDNGADFRSKSLDRSCLALGIDIDWRPIGKAHWGGHIERLLGTVMKELHSIPGSTFSNIRERFEYDSKNNALVTFSELEEYIGLYITKIYHGNIHRELSITPMKKWENAMTSDDSPGYQPRPKDPKTIFLDLLPYKERYVYSSGISINTINYYDDILRTYTNIHKSGKHKNKKQIFKYDPRDITKVWFYEESTQIYHEIPTVEPFDSLSIWKLNKIKTHWGKHHDTGFDESKIFQAMDELDEIINRAKKETRATRREKQKEIERTKSISQYSPPIPTQVSPNNRDEDDWEEDAFD